MVVGDPGHWADRFISMDDRLIARIIFLWPKCLSVLPPSPEEDVITINLRNLLTKDVEARQIFYHLEYQFEPEGFTPEGLAFSKGQIDLAVLVDQSCSIYLAYECKRLNVQFKSGWHSLATAYVKEGVLRFVTEQYADGLPVGCMIGYVLDGNLDIALEKVRSAMESSKADIGLSNGPETISMGDDAERFGTDHIRSASGATICLRHTLLPFPQPS